MSTTIQSSDKVEFKSLKNYIAGCISEFDYCDFAPPINPPINVKSLKKKFETIFYKENAYWNKYSYSGSTDEHKTFIEFKSFKNYNEHVRIAFVFRQNSIEITIFDEIISGQYRTEYYKCNINLYLIWLDHQYFAEKLICIFQKCIQHANRDEIDTPFSIN